VSREEASAHAGVPLAAGGLWFPAAGWIRPRSLVDALLERCGARLARIFSKEVLQLSGEGLTILATANDALCTVPHARLRRVRGQVSYVPAGAIDAPRVVVLRGGFALPAIEGLCVIGASFDLGDDDPGLRASSHAGNLERLRALLPGCDPGDVLLDGRVGFRWVAPDRLPLAGALGENVHGVLALGSRGLLWTMLAAELLASQLEGEPLPVEGKLADAVSPLRFSARALRREAARGSPSSRRSARTAPS
jgi:tRNA 5-methylaminomethyl-2-thiouridine biosynthesis bifunctional protein